MNSNRAKAAMQYRYSHLSHWTIPGDSAVNKNQTERMSVDRTEQAVYSQVSAVSCDESGVVRGPATVTSIATAKSNGYNVRQGRVGWLRAHALLST